MAVERRDFMIDMSCWTTPLPSGAGSTIRLAPHVVGVRVAAEIIPARAIQEHHERCSDARFIDRHPHYSTEEAMHSCLRSRVGETEVDRTVNQLCAESKRRHTTCMRACNAKSDDRRHL